MKLGLHLALCLFLGTLCLPTLAAQANSRVVVTVKPIHSLVAGVMAGVGEPYLIVKGSASPHTYAMKPSDASALQNAQVVFRVGGPFEGFLQTAINGGASTANVVSLADTNRLRRLAYRKGKAWAGAAHNDHDHDDKPPKAEDIDPHIWLDPDNAVLMVAAIAQTLGFAEPARMLQFAQNAAAMAARIKDLQNQISKTIAPVRNRPFLVFHDAFQYFETAFDIPATGAVSLGEMRVPGARRVRAIRHEILTKKIVCVFAEPQFDPKFARTLIEATPARLGTLDPIGADIKPGPAAYFNLMRRNANAFVECLGRK